MPLLRVFLIILGLVSAATLAHAQNTATRNANNAEKPIEISSDSLEVDQATQVAVFKGNVVAVQGDMRLKANSMEVHYRNKEEKAAAAPAAAESPNAVERIDVHGAVVLATPDEGAQGDDGQYMVDQKLLVLTGNVILTRGQNILRGTRLNYDMKTGKSSLLAAGGKAVSEGGTGGRVRGVFVTGGDDKQGGK